MRNCQFTLLLPVVLMLPSVTQAQTVNLATDFSYQGYLKLASTPVNATCAMTFKLFDALVSGNQIGTTQSLPSVSVTNGTFTVVLDFGLNVFTGYDRYLEITVNCGGGVQLLAPRQAMTPAPYALALHGLYTIPNGISPNIVGGFAGNSIQATAVGATIGGGGSSSSVNWIFDDYGMIGGGSGNSAGSNDGNAVSAPYATVAGGLSNQANNSYSTVSGGNTNTASSLYATIAGGYSNSAGGSYASIGGGKTHLGSGNWSTIGGGDTNQASAQDSTVGGGYSNKATGSESTVGGGISNEANGYSSTVAGGYNNTANGNYSGILGGQNVVASGLSSTVLGGENNTASGDYSVAMGVNANAVDEGSMVLGTDPEAAITSQGPGTFTALTENGFYIYTDSSLAVGTAFVDGGWSRTSDRNVKENFTHVDPQLVLASIGKLPVTTWNFITDENKTSHMGIMAQDFYAAFQLGDDDRHINDIDADGVLFAGVQALYELNQQLQAQVDDLKAQRAGGGISPLWVLAAILGTGIVMVRTGGIDLADSATYRNHTFNNTDGANITSGIDMGGNSCDGANSCP